MNLENEYGMLHSGWSTDNAGNDEKVEADWRHWLFTLWIWWRKTFCIAGQLCSTGSSCLNKDSKAASGLLRRSCDPLAMSVLGAEWWCKFHVYWLSPKVRRTVRGLKAKLTGLNRERMLISNLWWDKICQILIFQTLCWKVDGIMIISWV